MYVYTNRRVAMLIYFDIYKHSHMHNMYIQYIYCTYIKTDIYIYTNRRVAMLICFDIYKHSLTYTQYACTIYT